MAPKESIGDRLDGTVDAHDEGFLANANRAAQEIPFHGSSVRAMDDTIRGFSEVEDFGDLLSASGNMVANGGKFAAECAMEVTTFAMDPIGWLVGNGLDMLLELIQPLQDALHFVTGDGPGLQHAAGNFDQIAGGFVELAEDFDATGKKSLERWKEDAGNAARAKLSEFATGIKGIGTVADAIAETLRMWSMVMVIIEEVIKAIITELVSWLITIWLPALASSIVTFGGSVATAMAASVGKAASVFSKVTAKLGKLGKLLDEFASFLAKVATKMPILGKKLKNFEGLADAAQAVRKSGTVGKRLAQAAGKAGARAAGGAAGTAPGVVKDMFDDPAGGEHSESETRTNLDV